MAKQKARATAYELIERRLADPAAVPISVQFQTTLFEGGSVADLRQNN